MSSNASYPKPIRVLVVEDSPTVREFLLHVFSSDPQITVVGTAADGESAIAAVAELQPDVVTMDIHMPRLDGLEATRQIMERTPVPIVIVSANVPRTEAADSFRAVEAGAVTVFPRPAGLGHPDHEKMAHQLVRTVKLMSEVKVVRRWPGKNRTQPLPPLPAPLSPSGHFNSPIDIVAMGGSTGAPVAIKTILCRLPENFSPPILLVQHIAPNFVDGFAQWLGSTCHRKVVVASDGDPLLPGQVYVAPDGLQMGVRPPMYATLTAAPPEHGLRPSVSYLFRSVAAGFAMRSAGVLLSGMGRDGADALRLMREAGARTVVQDAATSIVHSMPAAAIENGAAMAVLPPEGIADFLAKLASANESKREL